MKKKLIAIGVAIALAIVTLEAQGIRIMSGATSDLVIVDTNKNLRIAPGAGTRPTYVASVSGQVTTAAYIMSIEAGASTGFKLSRFCVAVTPATAAAAITITLQRRTSASSGGTALTAEGTSGLAITKFDPSDGSFPGIARLGGTPGTAGADLGQWAFVTGEIGAGAADPPGLAPWCIQFGQSGDKLPTVAAGTSNGLSINVSASGAGGLTMGAIDAVVIAE